MKAIINRIKKIKETHLVPQEMFSDLQYLLELNYRYFNVNYQCYKEELIAYREYFAFREEYISKYKKLPTVHQVSYMYKYLNLQAFKF